MKLELHDHTDTLKKDSVITITIDGSEYVQDGHQGFVFREGMNPTLNNTTGKFEDQRTTETSVGFHIQKVTK